MPRSEHACLQGVHVRLAWPHHRSSAAVQECVQECLIDNRQLPAAARAPGAAAPTRRGAAGGGDFYMAAETGAFVHGVDLSVNMVLLALERASAARHGSRVSFEIADVTALEAAPGSYDVIYSRDTILHIHDKPALFRRCGLTPRASRPASRARAFARCKAAVC
jgi:hypothetical protein